MSDTVDSPDAAEDQQPESGSQVLPDTPGDEDDTADSTTAKAEPEQTGSADKDHPDSF